MYNENGGQNSPNNKKQWEIMKHEWTYRDVWNLLIILMTIIALPVGVLTLIGITVNILTCFLFYIVLGAIDWCLNRWVFRRDK